METRREEQVNPAIAARVQAQPEGVLESIASELGVSLLEVIRHLPQEQRTEMEGRHFEAILGEVATWGEVLTLVHTEELVLEVVGAFPRGKSGHGFYNLAGSGPLKGHLRADRCERIVYLRRQGRRMPIGGIFAVEPGRNPAASRTIRGVHPHTASIFAGFCPC